MTAGLRTQRVWGGARGLSGGARVLRVWWPQRVSRVRQRVRAGKAATRAARTTLVFKGLRCSGRGVRFLCAGKERANGGW